MPNSILNILKYLFISLEKYDERKYIDNNILLNQKIIIKAFSSNEELVTSTYELKKLKIRTNNMLLF